MKAIARAAYNGGLVTHFEVKSLPKTSQPVLDGGGPDPIAGDTGRRNTTAVIIRAVITTGSGTWDRGLIVSPAAIRSARASSCSDQDRPRPALAYFNRLENTRRVPAVLVPALSTCSGFL
jgi:hypothetical protein